MKKVLDKLFRSWKLLQLVEYDQRVSLMKNGGIKCSELCKKDQDQSFRLRYKRYPRHAHN